MMEKRAVRRLFRASLGLARRAVGAHREA